MISFEVLKMKDVLISTISVLEHFRRELLLKQSPTTRLRTFVPVIGTHPPGKNSAGTTQPPPHPAYTNGILNLLRLASVTQKNRPLNMLSVNVQFIDLLMDYMD